MQKKSIIALVIIDAMLLIGSVLVDLLLVYAGAYSGEFAFYDYVIVTAQILVSVVGIYYILTGCKKGEGTAYYKWYMIAFAFLVLLFLLRSKEMAVASVMLLAVDFGALCVLCFGKDLGKTLSSTFAIISVIVAVAHFFITLSAGPMADLMKTQLITEFVLAVTTLIMVIAKYEDKASRGSK